MYGNLCQIIFFLIRHTEYNTLRVLTQFLMFDSTLGYGTVGRNLCTDPPGIRNCHTAIHSADRNEVLGLSGGLRGSLLLYKQGGEPSRVAVGYWGGGGANIYFMVL
jgi:hypothetical protein